MHWVTTMDTDDIYLAHFGYAVGENRHSVEETFERGATFSPAEVLRDSGFSYHHTCAPDSTPYELATRSIEDLARQIPDAERRLESVDAIIYATCLTLNGNIGSWDTFLETKDVKPLMDFPVSHLQCDFNMTRAFVLGVNQTACTSHIGSIRVAKALLQSEPGMNTILCLTADRFPSGAIYEQGYNVISDGAAACFVQRDSGRFRIIDCHHITNGALAQASDDQTAGFYFNYTHRLVTEALERAGLSLDDIRWIVPQNTNIKAWEVLSSVLGFDYARVLTPTREQIGHCISGDNIINLKTADELGCFEPGDRILLPMAGFGLNWSSLLVEKVA